MIHLLFPDSSKFDLFGYESDLVNGLVFMLPFVSAFV